MAGKTACAKKMTLRNNSCDFPLVETMLQGKKFHQFPAHQGSFLQILVQHPSLRL
jgi:hypothetical protein